MDFGNWFKSMINPVEVFREEKKNANLVEAIKNVGVAGLIAGIFYAVIIGLLLLLFAGMFAAFGGVDAAGMGIAVVLIVIVAIIILFPIFNIISFLIESAILFIFAKIFGGKGDFTTQTYLISLPYAALILIDIPLTILGIIPLIGLLFSLLSLLIYIYALYPLTIALKEAHEYSTMKAVLTWLVPLIIIIVLVIILVILLLLPMFYYSQPPYYY